MADPAVAENAVAFPRLDPAQIEAVLEVGKPRSLRKGERLYSPGDRHCELLVLISGEVTILDAPDRPAERVVTVHRARQFVGELNLITAEPAYLAAEVTESGEAVSLDAAALALLSSRHQDIGDLVLGALVARRTLLVDSGSGARLVGSMASAETRELREFLARNRVPHGFVELGETSREELRGLSVGAGDLPILLTGSEVLRRPTIIEAATALNLRAANKTAEVPWDLVIVGGGPGGLGAAVYATTEGLETILVDAVAVGGQAGTSARIENYLGFPAGISGSELADRAAVQARRFGLKTAVPERAAELRREAGHYVVELESGDALAGRAIVLATGASYRRLPIDGLDSLPGVFHAATPVEASICAGGTVAVVGGGNSAGQAAVYLSKHADRVHLVVRGSDLAAGMSRYLVDQVTATANVEVHLGSEVAAVAGEGHLETISLRDGSSAGPQELAISALFAFIGADPCTDWLRGTVRMDDAGFLLTGGDLGMTHLDEAALGGGRTPLPLETSLPGVFAVGDGRSGSIKRVASAVGEGSMAIRLVHQHLSHLDAPVGVAAVA